MKDHETRRGRWIRVAARLRRPVRDTLLAAGALVLLVPSSDARLRFQSHRFDHICRVVVVADSPRGRRILYDGPVKRGQFKTFHAGDGTTVCVYRNRVPERCNSPMVGPKCRTDSHSNRTILFSID